MPQSDDYCQRCIHAQEAYGKLLCTVQYISRPVEYMRHPNSACGPDAYLFDSKDSEELDWA